MANLVPKSALQILERTLDTVRIRANADGEVFGGEIMDAMREAGVSVGADRFEVLLTRTVLVRAMESRRESYPAEVLQNFENSNASVTGARVFARSNRVGHTTAKGSGEHGSVIE